MKNLIILSAFFISAGMFAQVRIVNSNANTTAPGSSAFIDASSTTDLNATTNEGKGLLYPRVDLTLFASFGGTGVGVASNYPGRYDGLVVYNTATSGVAGVGATDGTLSKGFWYYDNPTPTGGAPTPALVNAGTWRRLGGDSSTIKSKTVTAIVAPGATSATLDVNGTTANKIAPGTVGTFLGAKIYNSDNKLVMTADSDYDNATNVFATGNGFMYQVLPAGTYTVIVDYK